MKLFILTLVLMLPACSEALDNETAQCKYTDASIVSHVKKEGSIVQYDSTRMPAKEGDERVLKEHLALSNGDNVTIEQSYCYMYNYTLTYQLAGIKSPTSLVQILPFFDKIISKSNASQYLVQPFSEIVLDSLSMPQKMLKIPFSQGLPERFTSTSENVEYSIDYSPLKGDTRFSTVFKVYIGIGGL
jgi:hypothetical protein